MFGSILLYSVCLITLLNSILYFLSYKRENLLNISQKLYYLSTVGTIIISAFLMINIFTHNFQYTYIWEYSSKQLPGYLLFSSFFAGQAGSFLLWTLFFAIMGIFFRKFAVKRDYEPIAMGFYTMIIFFLYLLLITKSPFELIWDTYKDMGATVGYIPENGRGLNPILENIWITIHPPILFIGYAGLAIPFVLGMAGLIKRDYQLWIELSLPWLMFASSVLGFGIILGGFWAYETLGWGGFWGWDPVENSSLLPWLISVALIHTMIVQKRTGGLIKTNFLLSILSFALVLYATFLTRSGILGEISVHSFADPGNTVYLILVLFLAVFTIIPLILLTIRLNDIKSAKLEFNFSSREFWIALGTIFILLSAVVVFLGTNWPLISGLFGKNKTGVEISFYNQMNLPIAILLLLTNGFSLYLNWKSSSLKSILKRSIIAFILSIIATVIIVLMGVDTIGLIVLGFSAFYSLFVNSEFALKNIKTNWKLTGGQISHFGVALLLLGILGSGNFDKSSIVTLKMNETKTVFDYNLTLSAKNQIEKEKPDREKYEYVVKIESGGSESFVKPIVYLSDFNRREAPFFEPGIKIFAMNDLYISPKSVEYEGGMPSIALRKGTYSAIPVDTAITMEFVSFDMSHSQSSASGGISLGVVVRFSLSGNEYLDTLYTTAGNEGYAQQNEWKPIPNTEIEVSFTRLIPNPERMAMSEAIFEFKAKNAPVKNLEEVIVLEASVKPMMNVVWLGFIAIILGYIPAFFRYNKK